jgi:hypothetical protein
MNLVEMNGAREELAENQGCPTLREDVAGDGDRAELTES